MNSEELKKTLTYFKPNNYRQRKLLLGAILSTIIIVGVNSLLGWLTPLVSWTWTHNLLLHLTQWTQYAQTISILLLVLVMSAIAARNNYLGELRALYSDNFKDWLEYHDFYIMDNHSRIIYPKVVLTPYGFKIDSLGHFREALLSSNNNLSDFLATYKSAARITRSSAKDGFVHFTIKIDFRKEQLHE
ncbi:MAG: hypothetical protein ACTIN4_05800 [Leuconostoc mesenteroides]|uniref:hypothetical protein n=1 Tax=Leuconostoc TaxID=1243 RepID=UPI001E596603|nr:MULTISPECIES: hypothetical protein [Leuconostoc]MCC7669589.1 hypothetical protein [Leuconostoc pseudomesenteroides]MCT3054662.1 hypothetical protein [Leuconostoc citreum]MCT3062621.1 hypothetical protein [Leuconostoc citreum]